MVCTELDEALTSPDAIRVLSLGSEVARPGFTHYGFRQWHGSNAVRTSSFTRSEEAPTSQRRDVRLLSVVSIIGLLAVSV